MAHHGALISGRKAQFALALAIGSTVEGASQAAGVSRRTGSRLAADPLVRSEMQRLRAELVSRTLGRAADDGLRAVEVLATEMQHAETASARIAAARALLGLLVQTQRGGEMAIGVTVNAQANAGFASPAEPNLSQDQAMAMIAAYYQATTGLE